MTTFSKPRYEDSLNQVVPLRVIAKRLGVSHRTVTADWARAVRKIRQQPEAFSVLLGAMQTREPLCAGSVECDREFIRLYGERG